MKIVCTSSNGDALTVQYAFPFYYVSCEGLMTYSSDVFTAEPYIPGEVYQGSHNPKRNLILNFAVKHREYWKLRETVYKVFGASGTFTWYPDYGEQRFIDYYVESIEFSDPNSRGYRECSVSLICPFPFFSGQELTVQMSYWKKLITLPFVMHSPFKIGERISQQIVTITNLQPINVGIRAVFTANGGDVYLPELQNLTTGESFRLNVSIPAGSSVEVVTSNGQKRARVLDDPQNVDIWNYDENDWLQLHAGDNALRYDASSGIEHLDVAIYYSQLYLGG